MTRNNNPEYTGGNASSSVGVNGGNPPREQTGGKTTYYEVVIKNPTRQRREQYIAECNDIIEALKMNFAEGEAFKAIWRNAAARLGKAKASHTDGLYDAQKVAFYGGRMMVIEDERRLDEIESQLTGDLLQEMTRSPAAKAV